MKNIVCLFIILLLLCVIIAQNIQINDYQYYYIATENLLDTLDNAYNWVDAYDPDEYYWAIDNLK